MLRVRTALTGFAGGPALSTFYFDGDVEVGVTADACLTRVRTYFASILAMFPSGIVVQPDADIDVITASTGEITDTLIATGVNTPMTSTGTASTLAPATALGLRLRTSTFVAGRRVQGRSFISPLATDNVGADGNPSAPRRAMILSAGTALVDAGGSGPALAVWHRPKAGAGGVAAHVVSCSASAECWVLRSRRD